MSARIWTLSVPDRENLIKGAIEGEYIITISRIDAKTVFDQHLSKGVRV